MLTEQSVPRRPLTLALREPAQWIRMPATVFTVALLVRLACFTGLVASDDLGYAGYARQIAAGTYELEAHHYAIRYGVIVPVAAIYRLFGIDEWTTAALPLICSSLAAALTALIAARLSGPAAGWVSGLLMATLPVEVRYASVLMPEPILQAIVLAGALLFLAAERRGSALLGLAAGAVFGLSYLTKEPGVFVALAFFAFALLQRRWRLALALAAGGALIVAGELAWYWSQSGDPLFRLHALGVHNQSQMAVEANSNFPYRLWKTYPRMMLIPNLHFGLHSLVSLALAALALLRRRPSRTSLLLVLWAVLPFLYLNFGTSSFDRYWALPAAPRYISLIFPPLFVLAAIALAGWAGASRRRELLAGVAVAVLAAVGISCAAVTRGTGYRSEDVRRLKAVAAAARRHDLQICELQGPERKIWHQVLQIVAPDRLGCSDAPDLQLLPDPAGLPRARFPGGSPSVGTRSAWEDPAAGAGRRPPA